MISNKVKPVLSTCASVNSSEERGVSFTTVTSRQPYWKQVRIDAAESSKKKNRWEIMSPNCPWQRFKSGHIEMSYEIFKRKKYVHLLICPAFVALCSGILSLVFSVLNFWEIQSWCLLLTCFFILVNSSLLCVIGAKEIPFRYAHLCAVLVNAYTSIQIFCLIFLTPMPSERITWMITIVYMVYVTVPLRYTMCLVLTTGILTLHSIFVTAKMISNGETQTEIITQIAINFTWFLSVTLFGSVNYTYIETKLRATFIDKHATTAAKANIENAKTIQEQLLSSALPRSIVEDISNNFSLLSSGTFKDMCKMCHDDVSILFASICGLQSLTYRGATNFAAILHDIVLNFDQLSKTYYMQNVNSLSGCYNFICGAPLTRADHALISVYFGVALVDYIRTLRRKLKEPNLSLRVGIHTGEVFCAVVGQKQFQFDIFGNDVMIARDVELSGKPGQVYISHATKTYLHEEFVIERRHQVQNMGHSNARDIKLYCVKYVVKQYQTSDYEKGTTFRRRNINILATDVQRVLDKSANYYYSLSNRFSSNGVVQRVTLYFNKEMEILYRQQIDTYFIFWIIGVYVFLLTDVMTTLSMKPLNLSEILGFSITGVLTLLFTIISRTVRNIKSAKFHQGTLAITYAVISTLFVIILVVLFSAITMFSLFDCSRKSDFYNETGDSDVTSGCLHPSYFITTISVLIVCVTSCIGIDHVTKFCILIGGISFLWIAVGNHYPNLKMVINSVTFSGIPQTLLDLGDLNGMVYVVLFTDRQVEKLLRKCFLISFENTGLNEKLSEWETRYEKMVNNLLPSHMVPVFIDRSSNKTSFYGTDLDKAGIAVISFPQFDDKMAIIESDVEGLECLDSLSEIFCTIDKMLEEPRFNKIFKLKSFGSMVIAACNVSRSSGSSSTQTDNPGATHDINTLATFVLTIKECISMNNRGLMMRAGIHTGPVLEGLLGGRKPRYDVWGNTIEKTLFLSFTSKDDEIQISEDTKNQIDTENFTINPSRILRRFNQHEFKTYILTGKKDDIK